MPKHHPLRPALALCALSLGLAHGEQAARLVIADTRGDVVRVFDLARQSVVASFTTPAFGSYANVYPTSNGAYAVALHRDSHRVSVIHGGYGAVNHGDHQDLVEERPYILATLDVGRKPTHYFSHGGQIAIFNDEDGTAAVLNEERLGRSLDFARIRGARPDHGAAVAVGGDVLIGYYELGRVDAHTLRGDRRGEVAKCAGLHGEATSNGVVAFGCADGVLTLRKVNGQWRATRIANPPNAPDKARVGTLAAHDRAALMVGNWPGGLAMIDPNGAALRPVNLGASPVSFRFTPDGQFVVALTQDGRLHKLSARGEVLGSLGVVTAMTTTGEGAPRPGLALVGRMAYVTDPVRGELRGVDVTAWKVSATYRIGGAPGAVAVVSPPAAAKR